MRGKVVVAKHHHAAKRITPAYAGKSMSLPVMTGVMRDHPRVCGEKAEQDAAQGATVGSPPRMRGKEGA